MNQNTEKNSLEPKTIEQIKQKLLDEKKTIEKLPEFLGGKTTTPGKTSQKFPEYGDDEEENANEIADYEASLSIEKDLGKTLRDINSALERIEVGSYGICKYCQKPIDHKRLMARPTSSSCIECKKTITQEV